MTGKPTPAINNRERKNMYIHVSLSDPWQNQTCWILRILTMFYNLDRFIFNDGSTRKRNSELKNRSDTKKSEDGSPLAFHHETSNIWAINFVAIFD